MNILQYLRANQFYFKSIVLLFIFGTIFLFRYGKSESFILLNIYHSHWLDAIFRYYTFFGDGIFTLCISAVILFYFKKKEIALAIFYGFIISGIAVQIIKKIAVNPRPKLFFEPGQYSYFIEGVTHSGNTSFPSGHTATAFALVTIIAILLKNKKLHPVFLLIVISEGYSRIYLAQHFLVDVMIGCAIGVTSAFPAIYFAQNTRYIKKYFQNKFTVPLSTVPKISLIQTA